MSPWIKRAIHQLISQKEKKKNSIFCFHTIIGIYVLFLLCACGFTRWLQCKRLKLFSDQYVLSNQHLTEDLKLFSLQISTMNPLSVSSILKVYL